MVTDGRSFPALVPSVRPVPALPVTRSFRPLPAEAVNRAPRVPYRALTPLFVWCRGSVCQLFQVGHAATRAGWLVIGLGVPRFPPYPPFPAAPPHPPGFLTPQPPLLSNRTRGLFGRAPSQAGGAQRAGGAGGAPSSARPGIGTASLSLRVVGSVRSAARGCTPQGQRLGFALSRVSLRFGLGRPRRPQGGTASGLAHKVAAPHGGAVYAGQSRLPLRGRGLVASGHAARAANDLCADPRHGSGRR